MAEERSGTARDEFSQGHVEGEVPARHASGGVQVATGLPSPELRKGSTPGGGSRFGLRILTWFSFHPLLTALNSQPQPAPVPDQLEWFGGSWGPEVFEAQKPAHSPAAPYLPSNRRKHSLSPLVSPPGKAGILRSRSKSRMRTVGLYLGGPSGTLYVT